MKNISHIKLVFDNCEEVRIDAKYIGTLAITGIKDEIVRVACNAICGIRVADEVAVEIFSEANRPFVSFGADTGMSVFDRILEWNDITHIDVVYVDGEDEYISVNYDEGLDEGKLGAQNILQTSKLSGLGNLYLVISTEGADIDKLFPTDRIDDKNTIGQIKRLYGVYDEEKNHE